MAKYATLTGKVRAINSYQPVVLNQRFDSATDPTYRTCAVYLLAFLRFSLIGTVFGEDGTGGANLETSSAGNT
jgi:hypothetical protein